MEDFVALLDGATADCLSRAEETMRALTPAGAESNWLRYGVQEGFYRTTTVTVNGNPSVVLYYWISACDKGLIITAAAAINGFNDPENFAVNHALDILANKLGCKYIQFQTRRKGLLKLATQRGFFPDTITMTKIL